MKQALPEQYELLTRQHYQDRAVAERYSEEYTGRWRVRTLAVRVVAARECRIVRRALQRLTCRGGPPIGNVLDLPCGTGKLAAVLGPFAFRVTAADISREMMEIAEREYRKLPDFVEFVQADAAATGFSDHEFDVVLCLRLLHRVPPAVRAAILRELQRICGKYVIFSAGLTDRFQELRRRARYCATGISTVPFPVTKADLAAELGDCGLKPLQWAPVLRGLSSEWIVICEKEAQ